MLLTDGSAKFGLKGHHLNGETSNVLFAMSSLNGIVSVWQDIRFVVRFRRQLFPIFSCGFQICLYPFRTNIEEERLDGFVSGLQQHIRLDVLKQNVRNIESTSTFAPHVDTAIFAP